ncbi:MAG: dihydrodipicolinate synthase family protein [Rhodothermales bacterium]|nr:dihydrodipicolinate synthase family protein [Rhodothermales bacterium]MBO6780982.1 dihydrodipicolinate synthase family protein [Rhodothermales bacterium]
MSFSGVWAASLTPLTADLDIDHTRFADHVGWLLENGCDGVALFGSTGEANSFSVAERTEAVDRLIAAGLPPTRMIAGAGACAFPDAVALSTHAAQRGLAGVLVTPPYYYKNVSDRGIFDFFRRLIDDVGNDWLRIVLYHFPRLVQVGFSEDLVAQLVRAFPQVVTGLKDSSGDLDRMKRLAGAHPSLAVLAGNEKLLRELKASGGAGCLTASANLTSRLAQDVWQGAGDTELAEYRDALSAAPFVPGLKQIMADHSGDASWLSIRPPLEPLSADAAAAFRAGLPGVVPNLR